MILVPVILNEKHVLFEKDDTTETRKNESFKLIID